jgi:hypothetical protein
LPSERRLRCAKGRRLARENVFGADGHSALRDARRRVRVSLVEGLVLHERFRTCIELIAMVAKHRRHLFMWS